MRGEGGIHISVQVEEVEKKSKSLSSSINNTMIKMNQRLVVYPDSIGEYEAKLK